MSDRLGLLEVARVPGPAMTSTRACGIAAAIALGDADVLRVERAGDEQHRHRELAEPVPVRRLRALPERAQLVGERVDGVRRRALVEPGARRAGSDANSGCASQRSRNASTPSRSISRASRSSASRRAARSAASAMPGDALTSTSRSHHVGRSSASCRHSRPPIEYPT